MELSQDLGQITVTIVVRLLGAVGALLIGRTLAGLAHRWLTRSLEKAGLTPSLITLLTKLSYYGIILLAVMVALAVIGLPTTTIVGATGIVVVVLAIDLQQSLGNLAATVNFLLFKPFEVGDVIETGGMFGVVNEIQLFSTVLDSPDNKTHALPDAKIHGAGLAEEIHSGVEVTDPPPEVILLDCESITDVDATALITLEELNRELERSGIDLRLARVRSHVLELMLSTDLEDKIGPANIYALVQDSVGAFLAEHSGQLEVN